MTRNGMSFRRRSVVPTTSGNESGLLHTPTANDGHNASLPPSQVKRTSLVGDVLRGMLPTPQAQDAKHNPRGGKARIEQGRQIHLTHWVGFWPTPTASLRERKTITAAANHDTLRAMRDRDPTMIGGQLNPRWVEWLMGFPDGWTALPPSGTPSSRKSPNTSVAGWSRSTKKGGRMPSQWREKKRPAGVSPDYLLVTGTRTFDDYDLLAWRLELVTIWWHDVVVCHGHSFTKSRRWPPHSPFVGADWHAEKWAEKNWYDREHFIADWEKHGKAAGPIRNKAMCEWVAARGGFLVAFWDGRSPGTAHCIEEWKRLAPGRILIQRY